MGFRDHEARLLSACLLATATLVASCGKAGFADKGNRQNAVASSNVDPNAGGAAPENGANPATAANAASSSALKESFVAKGLDATDAKPVEIIFAIDTSGSMDDEKTKIEAQMDAFVNRFKRDQGDKGARLFIISADWKGPTGTGIFHAKRKVNSRTALDDFVAFFRGQITDAAGKALPALRADALKHLVVITDDNASLDPAAFKKAVDADPVTARKTFLNGFVWLDGTSRPTSWCTRAAHGAAYLKVNELLSADGNKGLIQDLCTEDWSALTTNLATSIKRSIAQAEFPLSRAADAAQAIVVEVNGTAVPAEQFTYDAARQTIVFAAASAPAEGAQVTVSFFPATP